MVRNFKGWTYIYTVGVYIVEKKINRTLVVHSIY